MDNPLAHLNPRVLRFENQRAEILEVVKRPSGAVVFQMTLDRLESDFVGFVPGFPIISGPMYLGLRFVPDRRLQLLMSSPGAGTREATVDLGALIDQSKVGIIINWSPSEMSISAGIPGIRDSFVQAYGSPSAQQIRVTTDGQVVVLGSDGVQVRDASIFVAGQPVLMPTAIEAWQSTVEAIQIVQGASSAEGFLFEIVSGNMCLAMLVTGYETYCKTRFIELEEEGIEPDFDALATVFLRRDEIEGGKVDEIRQQALKKGLSPLKHVIQSRRIDFQDYTRCRRSYAKAYGLAFGSSVGIPNTVLECVQEVIRYRHRIVHVSATTSILNQAQLPGVEPVMANKEFVGHAVSAFEEFINRLHGASQQLNAPPFEKSE